MAITRVTQSGKDLILHDTNGTRLVAAAGIGGFWYVRNTSGDGGGGGTPPGGGGGGYRLSDAPISAYTGPYWDGSTVTYGATQCRHAWRIIGAALAIPDITRNAVVAALMCALVESVLWMYANENVPESYNYPHDLVGGDHDSVGLFQQRPSIPWGTVGQLMNHDYSTRAFIGGPTGPNGGNPPGLFDISPAWDTWGNLGLAVQEVQGSAHPTRYQNVQSTAEGLFDAMTTPISGGGGGGGDVINPFPGGYDHSDPFGGYAGGRVNPHTGSDWNRAGAVNGAPIPAMTAGTVVYTGYTSVVGNCLSVKMRDFPLYYAYLHLIEPPSVSVGQVVSTGQTLGRVGSTGSASTGAHLHVTISDEPTAYIGLGNKVDPYAWIIANGGEA